VNAFFLKYILWIPPTNPLNTLRLLILFLAALPTAKVWHFNVGVAHADVESVTRCSSSVVVIPRSLDSSHTLQEYYAYIDDTAVNGSRKLGFFAWLYCSMAVVETAVVIKFGRGMFPEPWPAHVLWFWIIVGTSFAVIMSVWVLRMRSRVEASKVKAM
jgi:phosphatidylserine synthase 2